MPFFNRISSALCDVGPFAPSTISFALILSAFFSLITFSRAAGIITSTSNLKKSSVEMISPPPNPLFFI